MPSRERQRRRSGEQCDVARRPLEQERQILRDGSVRRDLLERVDHHHVGVVRQREPRHVRAEGTRHERRRAAGDAARRERRHAVRASPRRRRRAAPRSATAWVISSSCRPSPARHRPTSPRARPAPRRPRAASSTVRRLLPRRRVPRDARRVKRGVLLQYPRLELLQRGRGLEAERLDEREARRTERLQRLRLPAGAIQRDHQLAAQPLVQRMLRARAARARGRARRRGRARARPRGIARWPRGAARSGARRRRARTARTRGRRAARRARARAPRGRAARPRRRHPTPAPSRPRRHGSRRA